MPHYTIEEAELSAHIAQTQRNNALAELEIAREEKAKLRRALEINADFWARAKAKSVADAGLIATMRELCSTALANAGREPARSCDAKQQDGQP